MTGDVDHGSFCSEASSFGVLYSNAHRIGILSPIQFPLKALTTANTTTTTSRPFCDAECWNTHSWHFMSQALRNIEASVPDSSRLLITGFAFSSC